MTEVMLVYSNLYESFNDYYFSLFVYSRKVSKFFRSKSERKDSILTVIQCFGGGILLGTSLIILLPEVNKVVQGAIFMERIMIQSLGPVSCSGLDSGSGILVQSQGPASCSGFLVQFLGPVSWSGLWVQSLGPVSGSSL